MPTADRRGSGESENGGLSDVARGRSSAPDSTPGPAEPHSGSGAPPQRQSSIASIVRRLFSLLPVTWAGQTRHVSPGFTLLALGAGAPIVPQHTRLLDGGRVRTTFLPPLEPGPVTEGREARIASLLRQYGEFVDRGWSEAPESLAWPTMEAHVAAAGASIRAREPRGR
jgi:hypothetical protein